MRDVGTLLEALPYIREFHGRTVVIKYGGAAMNDPELREDFARDVVLLKYVGMNPIVVHGGGPEITALHGAAEPAGRVRRRPAGERRGDRRGGQDGARRQGQQGHRAAHQPPRAAGGRACAGDDGLLFRVDTMEGPAGEDIGLVGRIDKVNIGVIEHIAADYIPVIASIGADRNGRSHNVNADEAAAAVARAMGAYKLMFLTDVPGWLSDPSDPSSVISETGADEVEAALAVTGGGMRPKLQACLDAIHGGVSLRAHRRRAGAALGAARAVHRRRPGHQDQARHLSALANTYARFPVEFASGSGCVLVDSEGNEYLDFLSGVAVLQHRPLPPARRGGDPGAGGPADARLEPVLQRADGPARGPARGPVLRVVGVLLQLGRGGQRGGIEARAQGAPARRHRGLPRRLPRPHLRRAVGHAAGVQAGAVRAAGAGLPADRCRPWRRSGRRSTRRRRRC